MPLNSRIIMLGTGDFALPTFLRLHETGHHLLRLVTQPDRPQGRKQELVPSRIKRAALERGIAVDQPEDVNAVESMERIRQLTPDLLVTAAYGQILSGTLLGLARLGGLNLHGSILPRYRGAAPVARAIAAGETETGVTVIRMTPRIDAGGIIATSTISIGPDETAGELEDRLALLGAPLMVEAIEAVEAGRARVLPQDSTKATKAPKLHKEDGIIDWSRTAQAIHDLVRAMNPWPSASTEWYRSQAGSVPVRLIVHKTEPLESPSARPGEVIEAHADRLIVAAGQGAVRLVVVQLPGKRATTAAEFLRGHRVAPGDRMGH